MADADWFLVSLPHRSRSTNTDKRLCNLLDPNTQIFTSFCPPNSRKDLIPSQTSLTLVQSRPSNPPSSPCVSHNQNQLRPVGPLLTLVPQLRPHGTTTVLDSHSAPSLGRCPGLQTSFKTSRLFRDNEPLVDYSIRETIWICDRARRTTLRERCAYLCDKRDHVQ